ncbi:hypothetical protein Bbelb_200670 [Branchiostoma belcheri]|nr:hypothetical protein Bbelb_200670 [Branchiostoma belcheri]
MCATVQGRLESDSKYRVNHTRRRITEDGVFSERSPPSGPADIFISTFIRFRLKTSLTMSGPAWRKRQGGFVEPTAAALLGLGLHVTMLQHCNMVSDVEKMELFLEVMKLPYMITVAMSSEKKPTSGQVLPILHKLEQHLLDKDEDDNFTKQIKSSIRDDLSTRYREQDRREFLEEASALDPRFKNSTGFPSDVWDRLTNDIEASQSHMSTVVKTEPEETVPVPLQEPQGVPSSGRRDKSILFGGLELSSGQKDLDTCDNNSTRMDDTATELLQNLEQPEEDARDEEGLDAAAALPTKEVTIKDAMPCIETMKDLCRTKDYGDMLQLIMTFETNPNKKAMEQTVTE